MKKILLIEDDKFLIKIYQNSLAKQGYEVRSLENGLGVLEMVKNFQPDLIILDLIMPIVDGFEALNQIRHDPQTARQPVFVLTALETREDIARINTLGVEKYFFKSNSNFNQIIDEINNYLK